MQRKKTQQQSEESLMKPQSRKDLINSLIKRRSKNKFLTENQKEYYRLLTSNQITICSGPAGVGKSYIAMKAAVDLLMEPDNGYEKIINKIIGKEAREKLKDAEIIEVFALAYMRGMNIDNSILIFEEAQNSTPNQMKLLLTRIGSNSKFFISGDLEQTDRYKDKKQSGLYDAITRFNYINDIGTFEFNEKDVVRNPLISKILQKYDEDRN